MSDNRLTEIKERMEKESPDINMEDIDWLIGRVETLEAENKRLKDDNEFLKTELRYLDYQGEIM